MRSKPIAPVLVAFVGLGPVSAASAQDAAPVEEASAATPLGTDSDGFETLWSRPTVYDNDNSGPLDEVRIVGRVHLDNYILESDVRDESDFLVRRARLGVRARLFGRLEAHVQADIDLEGGPLYSRLTDAYLAWEFSEAAELAIGKQSVQFTLDGSTSSNELLTIDRSNVANNLWFTTEYIPGISLSGRSGSWIYNAGVFSGGRAAAEFGDLDDGYFALVSGGYDFAALLGAQEAVLRADFVHNDPDDESELARPFERIGSLVFTLDQGNWGFSGDIAAGDGFAGQSDAWGTTLLPWIDLTDRLQLAGRYTYLESDGPNGLRLGRYENVVTAGRGDRYREVYAGLNYFIYGHRLKLQTGLTYADMRDRADDGGEYEGVTWKSALRLSW
ncbi:MAG: OprO/OprP family phosphate-selective porin [Alphaproteobacteria bacterium]|nr:OprO/OprP family phosphate-selective porin [Alphaproteobacteria bacterium]